MLSKLAPLIPSRMPAMDENAIRETIFRLDRYFGIIHAERLKQKANSAPYVMLLNLEQQALMFSGFVSDVEARRVNLKAGTVQDMLTDVSSFCDLIENQLLTK